MLDLDKLTGFTPGRWKVGYRALDVLGPSEKGGDMKICDIRGWGYLTGKGSGALGLEHDAAIAVQEANARLIAAAPELLALCRKYEAALKEIAAIEDNPYGADWEEIEEARGIANRAIGVQP